MAEIYPIALGFTWGSASARLDKALRLRVIGEPGMSSIDRLEDLLRSRVRPELLDQVAPPFVGHWKPRSVDLVADDLAQLSIQLTKDGYDQPWPMVYKALAVRSAPVACFPAGLFHHAVVEDRLGNLGQVGYLTQSGKIAPLSNRSEEVYGAVELLDFEISTAKAAADYFRLFCWSICGEAGPFQIVELADQLPSSLQGHVRARTAEPLEPILAELGSNDEEQDGEPEDSDAPPVQQRWQITTMILHDGQVFDADLAIMPGARVSMIQDRAVEDAVDKSHQWRLERFLRFHEVRP